MIYLALEIIAYLITALGLGVASGWLLRNLVAQRQEAELGREMGQLRRGTEALEAHIRAGEERSEVLRAQVRDRDARLSALLEAVKSQEDLLDQRERRIVDLESRLAREMPVAQATNAGGLPGGAAGRPAGGPAGRPASGEALVGLATPDDGWTTRVGELQAELERAERALETERRRVAELQRERALQLNILKALHQQLEMARERAAQPQAAKAAGRAR